jgi:hypothetical protein
MSQSEFGNLSATESDLNVNDSHAEHKSLALHPVPVSQTSDRVALQSESLQHENLENKSLEQEMKSCYAQNEQIHVLLYQAQEQLVLSQQVIECQEALTETLQKRIEQLEHDLQIKSALIEQANSNCDELKERLKRQQHRNAQLKAAYEKRLEIESELPKEEIPHLESWAIAKLAEEKINPIPAPHNDASLQNVVQIMPSAPEPPSNMPRIDPLKTDLGRTHPTRISTASTPIPPLPDFPLDELKIARANQEEIEKEAIAREKLDRASLTQSASQNISQNAVQNAYQPKLLLSQVSMPKFMQVLSDVNSTVSAEPEELEQEATSATIANKRNSLSSFAAVKLPQFPPLRRS